MQLYERSGTDNIISDEVIEKFLKVFDYGDDTYAEIDHNIGFIVFADLYVGEDFLDKCLKKGFKNDKAINYYWKDLEKYENSKSSN